MNCSNSAASVTPILLLSVDGVSGNGTPHPIHQMDQILVTIDIETNANVEIEGRQLDGDWKSLDPTGSVFTSDDELNIENYGWYEIRATANTVTDEVTVYMTGR